MNKTSKNILEDQAVAGYVLYEIQQKAEEQANRLVEIANNTNEQMRNSINAWTEANKYIEQARDFVSPNNVPHILGSDSTKHGEVAEALEVCFRNGRDVLNRCEATAELLQGPNRTGPYDYVIDGVQVQSKFLNGMNKSLEAVEGHLQKYSDYASNFQNTPIYHIPKDQYEDILRVMNGETSGMSQHTINACRQHIQNIEKATGQSFTDVVKPSLNTYRDVQLGKAGETISAEEQSYAETHQNEVKEIRKEDEFQKAEAQHITDASWGEAFKAAGVGAAISGTFSAGFKVYAKIKGGKKITDFNLDDWKEVGLDFAKGGVKGAVSGMSVYGLTKLAGFSAPFAGAMVSSAIGATSLFIDYKKGKITKNDFADGVCSLTVEAGISAIGAAIGQAVIPIPVLGGLIGTVVFQSAYKITERLFGKKEKELIAKMKAELELHIKNLDAKCKKLLDEINAYFDKLGGLISAALSPEPNNRLNGSIELARFVGVAETEIIHNTTELDDFMLS